MKIKPLTISTKIGIDSLFCMADQCLSEEKQEELVEDFEKLEVERIGIGKHEQFHAILDHLADIYLK